MFTFKQKVIISKLISSSIGRVIKKNGSRVLMYHSIGTKVDGDKHGIYNITKHQFSSQIKALVEMDDINVVSINDLLKKPNNIVITFDDGFSDTYEVAAPILEEAGLSFTVFISPGLIKSNSKQYLDEQSLLKLSNINSCNIGAHGYSHQPLTECNNKQLQNELEDSKKWLEDLLSTAVNTMSYPHGAVDQRVRNAAHDAGYLLAASSKSGANTAKSDLLQLHRTDIWSIDNKKIFRQKIAGNWDWIA